MVTRSYLPGSPSPLHFESSRRRDAFGSLVIVCACDQAVCAGLFSSAWVAEPRWDRLTEDAFRDHCCAQNRAAVRQIFDRLKPMAVPDATD